MAPLAYMLLRSKRSPSPSDLIPSHSTPSSPLLSFRCVAAEIERVGLIESGELDEDEAHHDPVPAITKVSPAARFKPDFLFS